MPAGPPAKTPSPRASTHGLTRTGSTANRRSRDGGRILSGYRPGLPARPEVVGLILYLNRDTIKSQPPGGQDMGKTKTKKSRRPHGSRA